MCGPRSGFWPEPRCHAAMTTHSAPEGAVQVSRPSATCVVTSWTLASSSTTGWFTGREVTFATCTAIRVLRVTPDEGATTGSGSVASYVVPPATLATPCTSSWAAPGLSGVIVGVAAGHAGPMVMSIRRPRCFARVSALWTASRQGSVPQPWPSGSSGVDTEWWTSAISSSPNPASATWSTSRAISTGSTRPCGHHQRNPAR